MLPLSLSKILQLSIALCLLNDIIRADRANSAATNPWVKLSYADTITQNSSPKPGSNQSPISGSAGGNRGNVSPITASVSQPNPAVNPIGGGVGPSRGNVSPITGSVQPSYSNVLSGNVGPNRGGVSPISGNVSPISGNVYPSRVNVGPISGVASPTNANPSSSTNAGPAKPSVPNKKPQGANADLVKLSYADTLSNKGSTPKPPNQPNMVTPAKPFGSSAGTTPSTAATSGSSASPLNPSNASDDELREFSENLLKKDVNNAAKLVQLNLQSKTTSFNKLDVAPQPLLQINPSAFNISTISKLLLLHNNYEIDSNVNEHVTAQERLEENELMDTIVNTPVMQHARNFLISKGKISKDPKEFRDLVKQMWFNMYSRGEGRIGSSGFEHIFLAEIKKGQISGLHNWVYFNAAEKAGKANYLGYMKKIDLADKGSILKYHFTLDGIDKPVGTMFIGTSPELEMALYTTCYILRPDVVCPLQMGGKTFVIRTYNYRYRSKNMIGSAFPEI